MSSEAWVTLAVTLVAVALMIRGAFSPGVVLFAATVTLLVFDVTEAGSALGGFSNAAPFTVAALFVLARAAESTGAIAPTISALLGRRNGYRRSMSRLLVPAAVSSAALNNTPIVAMLSPGVSGWAEHNGESPSRYLMPLSFAAILGGITTVIGTSTNVAVSGLLDAQGHGPLDIFEISKVGVPIAIAGIVLLILITPLTLPLRRAARRELTEEARDFAVDMLVVPGGTLDGQEVETGGLRHLEGVYLVRVERGAEAIAPVPPTTVLRGGDRLQFVGQVGRVVDLQGLSGLATDDEEPHAGFEPAGAAFFEAVLGDSSPLIGQNLRDAEFRSRYQAAVVAIHRAGQRVDAKLGDVRLRVGDTLLLLSDPDFRDRWYDRRDFLLVSELESVPAQRTRKSALVGLVIAGIVALAVTGTMGMLEASLLGAVALVGLGVLTPAQARNAVDFDVIITIASSFGVAAAIEESGLAAEIADGLVGAFDGLGTRGVLLGVVLATVLLTELITNNAAAVLMFPIAIASAAAAGVEPHGAAIAVAIAASASFLTPIGYQTNTMVYGPGGYRFTDYARLGAPLTLLVIVGLTLLVPEIWGT